MRPPFDKTVLASWGRQIGGKAILVAVLTALLALASGSTWEQAYRFLAAFCLLTSLALAVSGLTVRPRPFGTLSAWDQALIFSLIAGGAHLVAELIKLGLAAAIAASGGRTSSCDRLLKEYRIKFAHHV